MTDRPILISVPMVATPKMTQAALDLIWENSETHGQLVQSIWQSMHKESPETAITTAAYDVLEERKRQIEIEGCTTEHDDQEHDAGELAAAAASYALHAADAINPYSQSDGWDLVPDFWPFSKNWWKPNNDEPRRDLVKAGALILAEIERLDRQTAGAETQGGVK
ncbi:hypothetical protein [Brucella pituitosa]|uniref:hypothetical protein n=1 Tax=Brucella pituitosa TaxID=571256 RepID=UPI003F4A993A